MNGNYRITDNGDTIQFHGVDVGGGMKPKQVHYRSPNKIVVVKIPGHNRWGDQLHPSVYEPASFLVLRLVGDDEAEPLVDFPVR